jgi:hypothetical protein
VHRGAEYPTLNEGRRFSSSCSSYFYCHPHSTMPSTQVTSTITYPPLRFTRRETASPPVNVKSEPVDIIDLSYEGTTPAPGPSSHAAPPSGPEVVVVTGSGHDELPIKPLKYQRAAIQAIENALQNGDNRVGVTAPTGAGKTLIYGSIIQKVLEEHPNGKAIVFVGSSEQAKQAKRKVKDMFGQARLDIGLEHNISRAEIEDRV